MRERLIIQGVVPSDFETARAAKGHHITQGGEPALVNERNPLRIVKAPVDPGATVLPAIIQPGCNVAQVGEGGEARPAAGLAAGGLTAAAAGGLDAGGGGAGAAGRLVRLGRSVAAAAVMDTHIIIPESRKSGIPYCRRLGKGKVFTQCRRK